MFYFVSMFVCLVSFYTEIILFYHYNANLYIFFKTNQMFFVKSGCLSVFLGKSLKKTSADCTLNISAISG